MVSCVNVKVRFPAQCFSVTWWLLWLTSVVGFLIDAFLDTRPLTLLLMIWLFEYLSVKTNGSCNRSNWHFCFIMHLLCMKEDRSGFWAAQMALIPTSPPPLGNKLGEWLMVAENKRDVRRKNLCAVSVLVSCFYSIKHSGADLQLHIASSVRRAFTSIYRMRLICLSYPPLPTGRFVKMAASHPYQLAQVITDCSSGGCMHVLFWLLQLHRTSEIPSS